MVGGGRAKRVSFGGHGQILWIRRDDATAIDDMMEDVREEGGLSSPSKKGRKKLRSGEGRTFEKRS